VGRLNTSSIYVEIKLISVRVEVANSARPTPASGEELRVAQEQGDYLKEST
jgi:hypothetical protein